jgi:type III secretory pathway component EscT
MRIAMAWARIMPSLVLVPAFGLKSFTPAMRAALGLLLAICIFPALPSGGVAGGGGSLPWAVLIVGEVLVGLPAAILAAAPIWAAIGAGSAVDLARGGQENQTGPLGERTGTFGTLFSLLAAFLFFATGGPSRLAGMALVPLDGSLLVRLAWLIERSIGSAVALAAPVLAASIVVETASAVMARAASPAQIQAVIAPMRSLSVLLVAAFAVDRVARAIELTSW